MRKGHCHGALSILVLASKGSESRRRLGSPFFLCSTMKLVLADLDPEAAGGSGVLVGTLKLSDLGLLFFEYVEEVSQKYILAGFGGARRCQGRRMFDELGRVDVRASEIGFRLMMCALARFTARSRRRKSRARCRHCLFSFLSVRCQGIGSLDKETG